MLRTISTRLASICSAAALALIPSLVHAQKALVYCPVGIDATGCNAVVAALAADAARFPGGADAGYDGTEGTVDLASADLAGYAVFVVPSLADGPDVQPYALLRNATIAARLRAAFMGRTAVWSGTPDVGSTNRAAKNELIRNLAGWARSDSAGTHGPGVVALQDNTDNSAARYGWLSGISTLSTTADTTFEVYSNVQVLTATGRTILTNGAGLQIGYTNMASYGLIRGADASGATDGATGGRTTRVVLVTAAGDPSDPNIATVRTDREDYFPPDTVIVTGAGWEPGETVSLVFHEDVDPQVRPDVTLTAIADGSGHILNQEFVIDSTHVGARFTLTATGLTSGRTAQTTFTDANRTTFSTAAAGSQVNTFGTVTANQCVPAFVQARQGSNLGNESGTVTLSSTPAGAAFFSGNACAGSPITTLAFSNENAKAISFRIAVATSYTITGDGSWSTTPNDASATVTVTKLSQSITFTSTPPTPALVGGTYAAAATATSGLTVTFGTSTPAVCTSSGTNGATINLIAAGTCTVTANQAGNGTFNAAPQVTQSFTVQTATTTAVASSLNPSNVGQSVTFTATVQMSGGGAVTSGNVTFIEGGTCAAPTTTLKPATGVNGSGQATFTTSALSAGSHTITACYAGTATFAASNGSVLQKVNALPVVTGVPASATIPELVAYSFDANATDSDLPAQPLVFSLVGAPAGATIDPSTGLFDWTPSEAQGPGTYPFSVRVSDGLGNTDAPITLTVTEVNQPPALAAIGNRTVNELATLSFTATATDGDLPAQTLAFSLDAGAPTGATITTAGAFSWTPTEAQGPGDYPVTVRVSDGVANDFETISIHVDEVNQAPVVTAIADQTVDELATLTFTATATDADVPVQTVTFDLVGAPTGAAITPAGAFTWTPTEAQGPGTYAFQVRATDDFTTPAAGTTTVKVTVNEVNQPPVLAAIGNKTTDELVQLAFTATATDPDLPANTLTFSLDAGAPAGAAITTGGAFAWTPTEAQGPGDYPVTIRVSDGTTDDFETISIHVDEVNQAPVVTAIADQAVDELATLTFTASATDADLPANTFTFSLDGAPAGAAITAAGLFSWTPTEAQGPGVYTFKVVATDNGTPALPGETTVKVTVNEVNEAPVLAAIGNKSVDEETALTFTAGATDPDLPANALSYALVGAPAGAGIDASSGAFSWTPTEAQGPGSFTFTVTVTDDGSPALSDEEEITVTVNEVNKAPIVAAIPDKVVDEETPLTFTASATDPDVPANAFLFSLSGAPAGAIIDPTTGAFTWTPTEAEGPGVYTFQVVATDNGSPALAGQTTVKVTVNEVNVAPVLAAIGNKSVDEETALTFTATATDADIPANTLTFSLVGAPAGASITGAGAFTWTPTEAQGPGSYTFKVRVTDDGTPALADEEEITVEVKEVNKAPVVTAIADQTVDEEDALSFTATAVDPDLPANDFTFSLDGEPTGATITAAGAFGWTPTEAQGPGVYTFKVRATDDGSPSLTGETTVQVTVNEVNRAPVLAAIGDQTVDEETALTFGASATDPDLPANTLAYALVGAPAGATIDASTGAFGWTPSEAQGPGSYTFTIKVSDNGSPVLSDEEEITVTVNEVNVAPEVVAIGNQTVDELAPLTFTATATDHDLPANTLAFSLDAGAPTGASITSAGVFTWSPTEAQGPGSYPVTVRVTDNGTPALSGFETITIQVNEVNVAPELAAIGNRSVDEETALTFTASATDADLPANTLTFSLIGAPAGAAVDGSSGAFAWTPSEAQGPGSYTFTVRVTDNGTPALSDEEEITVTVNEVNRTPVLAAIADQTTPWGAAVSFTASATDPDLPANTLTYTLRPGAPAAASINPTTGAFTWTPGIPDVGTHPITVRVTDNGNPVLYAEQSFSVAVEKHLTSVVYSGASSGVYGNPAGVSATLTDVTVGTPLSGKSVGFAIGALNTSATTQSGGAAGFATTTLSLAQNVGSYLVATTFVEDAGYVGSIDSDPFAITPAPLTVTAGNKTMFYGAASPPPFTVVYTGFVLGQNSGVLGGVLTFGGTAAGANGTTPVGTYVIAPTGLSSSNYAISFMSGTLTIIYNNVAGHQFLQPINPNLTTGNRSSFKIGSTIPAKFQLFKADGTTAVTTAVATISVTKVDNTPDAPINEEVITLPPDDGVNFRVSGSQYIFNLGTKGWTAGTYRITANLDDGSKIIAEVDGRSK